MWSEILKIKPQLDTASVNSMEQKLSGRFGNLAKKFGAGLKKAIIGGGIATLAIGVVDKLLNPLKETQDVITRMLGQSDDIVTNAKQFETTAGKLFKLQQLGKSVGLDEQSLFMMMGKFQVALAHARADEADPTKEKTSPLRAFVNETDTAEAFFKFSQALQQSSKDTQVLVQEKIFGERMMGRAAEFFQTDFAKQFEFIGAKGSEEYTPALEKIGSLSDLNDALASKRTLDDMIKKAGVMNEGMILSMDKAERQTLEQENRRLASYEDLKNAAVATQDIKNKMEDMFLYLSEMTPKVVEGINAVGRALIFYKQIANDIKDYLKNISSSRLLKGFFK